MKDLSISDRAVSPAVGVVLLIAVTVVLAGGLTALLVDLGGSDKVGTPGYERQDTSNGIQYRIIKSNAQMEANGVPVGRDAGDSETVLPDDQGNVNISAIKESETNFIERQQYTDTIIRTDGSIVVDFNSTLNITSSTVYDWELVGGMFYPSDPSGISTGNNGGTQFVKNTDAIDGGVSIDDSADSVLVLARDTSTGDVQASTMLSERNDEIDSSTDSQSNTLDGSGSLGSDSEKTTSGYDGQQITFTFNDSTVDAEPVDWAIVEENGATVTDTPPSNSEDFTSTLDLSDPQLRGNFIINASDPSSGDELDRVQVFVTPVDTTTETVLIKTSPKCSDVTFDDSDSDSKLDIDGVKKLQCISKDLNADYELTSDIQAGGTDQWNSGKGFKPIGDYYGSNFAGNFSGNGYTVKGLYIDRGSTFAVGMFVKPSSSETSTIENITLKNVDITGDENTGSLIGRQGSGMVVRNVTVDGGTVETTDEDVGGIVGRSGENIYDSTFKSGTVKGPNAGGLIGLSDGGADAIRLESKGTVTSTTIAGGVIGYENGGLVNNTVSSATVEGDRAGGIIGVISGTTLNKSYATGTLRGADTSSTSVGGLAAEGDASIHESYSTVTIEDGSDVGGIVADSEGGHINDTYAGGNLNGSQVGGIAADFAGTAVNNTFSFATLSATVDKGGICQNTFNSNNVQNAWWDEDKAGTTTSCDDDNSVNLTTSEMQGSSAETNMGTLDFSGTWKGVSGEYPVLRALDEQTQLNNR